MKETQPPPRPRAPLANWKSVSLGNNPNQLTVDEMMQGQFQWNMVNDNTTDNRQGHRHDDHDNKPAEET